MKEFPCWTGGSNRGPLACESEMLTTTLSDLVERRRSYWSLYTTIKLCMCVCKEGKAGQGCCTVYTYLRTVSSKLILEWYICFLPGWSGREIKCTVHVALPNLTIN